MNPRLRPWQGRTLPLSYSRFEQVDSNDSRWVVKQRGKAHRGKGLRIADCGFERAKGRGRRGKGVRNCGLRIADLKKQRAKSARSARRLPNHSEANQRHAHAAASPLAFGPLLLALRSSPFALPISQSAIRSSQSAIPNPFAPRSSVHDPLYYLELFTAARLFPYEMFLLDPRLVLSHVDLLTRASWKNRMRGIGLTVARRYRRETSGQKQRCNVIGLIPSRVAPFVLAQRAKEILLNIR